MIADVIYSSETTSEEQPSGIQEEYERLKTEIREQERELQHLQFRGEVLRREKELLTQFANHVCNVQSVKVIGIATVHVENGISCTLT